MDCNVAAASALTPAHSRAPVGVPSCLRLPDLTPWINFLLTIIRRGYVEFEERAGEIIAPGGVKTALVFRRKGNRASDFTLSMNGAPDLADNEVIEHDRDQPGEKEKRNRAKGAIGRHRTGQQSPEWRPDAHQ